jgi:formylglycine-generating enzyme required for sulfatase activity
LTVSEESALKPKDSFKECDVCPEMVVVPAGSFTMGSSQAEIEDLVEEVVRQRWRDRKGAVALYKTEGPQRQVHLARPFAVGKYEVTFAEWDACVAAGGCNHRPYDSGRGRGKQPVRRLDSPTSVPPLSRARKDRVELPRLYGDPRLSGG